MTRPLHREGLPALAVWPRLSSPRQIFVGAVGAVSGEMPGAAVAWGSSWEWKHCRQGNLQSLLQTVPLTDRETEACLQL